MLDHNCNLMMQVPEGDVHPATLYQHNDPATGL